MVKITKHPRPTSLWSSEAAESVNYYHDGKKILKVPMPYAMDKGGTMIPVPEIQKQYGFDTMKQYAKDSWGGFNVGVTQMQFNQINSILINNVFLGYGEYSLLLQNGILNSMCDILATDMCRNWIELVSNDDNDDKQDKILELEEELERLDLKKQLERACFLTFAMGGCLLAPKLKGDELNQERENELYIDSMKIHKGDLEYLAVIEPIWYVPIRYVTDNPFSEWFYKTEFYTVIGMITHASRICHFTYNEAPNILKPSYVFNGMPLLGMCIPYVMNFEQVNNAVPQLITRYKLSVLKTDMQSIISNPAVGTGGTTQDAQLKNRITVFNTLMNNTSTMVLDKDEEFEQITFPLTGIKELQEQLGKYMSIVSKIHPSKLLGTEDRGLSGNGETSMKIYHEQITTLQEKILRPHLIKILDIAMLNIWGEIDKNITFNFCPLEESNELEISQIRLNKAQEAQAYVTQGVITPLQVAQHLAQDDESGWNNLEIKEEDYANELARAMTGSENIDGSVTPAQTTENENVNQGMIGE